MIRKTLMAAGVAALVGTSGCTDRTVQREDPNKAENVTMELGLTDIQETAENMKNEIAGFNFPDEDKDPSDGRVRVRVFTVANDSSEHFNVKILTDKIRKVMLSSGKIVCVAEKENIAEIHQERAYGEAMSEGANKPKQGKVKFGRYGLVGRIKAIKKQNEDVKLTDYIFTLDLVNTETEEILLTAEKEIRKVKNK
jgi:PBP1b-binding outer membrane lipoprotein LpoB